MKKEQQVSMKIEVVLRALFSLVLCDYANEYLCVTLCELNVWLSILCPCE